MFFFRPFLRVFMLSSVSLLLSFTVSFPLGECELLFAMSVNSTVKGCVWLTRNSVWPAVKQADSPLPKHWPSTEDGLAPSCWKTPKSHVSQNTTHILLYNKKHQPVWLELPVLHSWPQVSLSITMLCYYVWCTNTLLTEWDGCDVTHDSPWCLEHFLSVILDSGPLPSISARSSDNCIRAPETPTSVHCISFHRWILHLLSFYTMHNKTTIFTVVLVKTRVCKTIIWGLMRE